MKPNTLSTAAFTASFLGQGLSHTIPVYLRHTLRKADNAGPEHVRTCIQQWAQCIIETVQHAGVEIKCEGWEHIPDGPCIFASGHQSMLEIFIMLAHLPNVSFVMNRYADLPLLGKLLRVAGEFILPPKRSSDTRKQLIRWGAREAALGRSLVIYPEGKILPPGTPRELKPGVYYLFRALGLPVVPIEVQTDACWSANSELWRIQLEPGQVEITFKEPIYGPSISRSELMEALREQIRPAA